MANSLDQLDRLHSFVTLVAQKCGLTDKLRDSVNLALEEAVVNVIDYAYPTGTTGQIDITAETHERQLCLTITDRGAEFDPTAVDEADTSSPLEERQIGGLGIFLMRNIMDTVSYRRVNDTNRLTMTIGIDPAEVTP
jgi:sigma-B regulation protein RsbU (phosphoserine phosphatase)